MQHTEFNWNNAQSIDIYAQKWEVEQPKAMVLMVHGMGEHSTRYKHMAEFFAANNIGMFTYDHVGHGKSDGKRGHVGQYEFLLDDIDTMLAKMKAAYPDIPHLVYGHSMGGNLVLNYGIRRKPAVNGLIVSGPWLKLAIKVPGFRLKLAKMMNSIYPKYTEKTALNGHGVTRDKECAEAYNNDPLVHGEISTRFFFGIHSAGLWAIENAAKLQLPTLLMHGDDDQITLFDASKEFAQNAKDNVQFKPYPKLYHELHNEPEKVEVLKDILAWIDGKI